MFKCIYVIGLDFDSSLMITYGEITVKFAPSYCIDDVTLKKSEIQKTIFFDQSKYPLLSVSIAGT